MDVDLAGATQVFQVFGPVSQPNNTGGGGIDLQSFDFVGEIALTVAIGKQTAGDANGTITVQAMTSATNNISNAVNYVPTKGPANVSATNNTAAVGDISIDTRNALRYLFVSPAITGANTPTYPLAAIGRGVKRYQPS